MTRLPCLVVLCLTACRPAPPAPAPRPPSPETSENPRWEAVWEDARRRGVDFRGLGQEPGWYVEVKEGEAVLLVADYGERRVVTPAPSKTVQSTRTTYRARTAEHTLSIVVEATPCNDAMSGIPFEATVTVTLDDQEYRGCGRALP
jgi:putative lipoprotein